MDIRLSLAAAVLAGMIGAAQAQDTSISFFVTSKNPGKGGDLGGLAGADAYCKSLAAAVGAGDKNWRAYLSTDAENAKDRIGAGPWYNAKGEKIADDVASLHSDANNITKETALDENGNVIGGRGDTPNRHDILTGSAADGTAVAETCGNWTMGGAEGAAMLGHHDRKGPATLPTGMSWNAAHPSRGGCSQEAFAGTGGDGLFYCFVAN
jgi:hypothetical protein